MSLIPHSHKTALDNINRMVEAQFPEGTEGNPKAILLRNVLRYSVLMQSGTKAYNENSRATYKNLLAEFIASRPGQSKEASFLEFLSAFAGVRKTKVLTPTLPRSFPMRRQGN